VAPQPVRTSVPGGGTGLGRGTALLAADRLGRDTVPPQSGNGRRPQGASPIGWHHRIAAQPHLLLLSDVAAIVGCLAIANAVVSYSPHTQPPSTVATVLLAMPLPVTVVAAFAANGLYVRWQRQLLSSSFTELRDIAFALALAGCLTLGFDHLFGSLERRSSLEPMCIVAALLMSLPAVAAARAATRGLLRVARVERFRVLIVGSGTVADHLRQYLSWDPRVTVVGAVDDEPVAGSDVIGTLTDLPRLCAERDVDQVLVAFPSTHPTEAMRWLQSLDPHVAVSIVPRYFELLTWRAAVREIWGLPVVEVAPATLSRGARLTKRSFDIVVATLLLVLAAPVMAVVALAVKATSPGPVLFRQVRLGRQRRPFVMLKFRTMRLPAPGVAPDPPEPSASLHGALSKPEYDPRVTGLGRVLRRASLDELPQLLNVLRGEMSIVGPRPFVPEESDLIDGPAERRFEMRPGMTGLWQVSGRSHLDRDDLLRLDYLYVAAWSIAWDLRILWYTPVRVMRGHGAF
jgi:exopolysaccharide biosynthesis polyprenyl glycosylphosphotransferase